MKNIYLLFTLTLSTLSNAWTIQGMGEFSPEKLSNNLLIIHGPSSEPSVQNQGFMNNPGIIIGKKGVIIVDPGSAYSVGKKVIKEVEKITKKPIIAVFNTHVHGDHWLGNQAIIEKYPSAKIYAHPQMVIEAKNGEGDNWVNLMVTLTDGLTKDTIATYPTDTTQHLQVINLGSEQFKIHSPTIKAHTNTDIMIEHVNSKTLFLGDNGFVNRMGRFDNSSSMHDNIKVLQYATGLGLDYYVPGHGSSGNANHAVKPFLDYLLIIQDEAKNGYEQDLAGYEIKPIATKRLTAYKNWHGFNEQFGKHIGKMLLEIEALDL
ncbi:beta-lactamase family protein [Abyssogena phaseoliformis symbiont OG214]|uniref:MBL fold metallo-hydrolase n=1 Tax=Abyssogena phaseoliformis symbiont TaxID=596095 RepID=UPI001915BAF6|nr:MBL fold metallo-hydrolase [Abyssogena phaseoliformis symbiont]MBW5289600.1 Beta-lactamase-like precursor [Candidatus Ruthia sp. Apha_13_S6]BBB23226.1 beta-lactamase family protein [Abyssogena phaseoliformis symbiont OG214]